VAFILIVYDVLEGGIVKELYLGVLIPNKNDSFKALISGTARNVFLFDACRVKTI
jgi:hypothetical protein